MAKRIQQMTARQFDAAFPHEDACYEFLIQKRWPNGMTCPRCGSASVYDLKTMKWKFECPDCAKGGAYRFSPLVGTIFENTNMPLKTWYRVIHAMLTAKKGVSANQIYRTMDIGSYKTAWYMCHRIRAGLAAPKEQLGGIVEMDESYIGGKNKNKHWDKRGGGGGGMATGKEPIIGAVSRKGNVVAKAIDRVDRETIARFVSNVVSDKVSTLITDDARIYDYLASEYPHKVINHSARRYVVGAIHTNTIEGFWSIFKRGVVGTFHKVSAKYMPLYVREFEFRYNNRNNEDIFGEAFAAN